MQNPHDKFFKKSMRRKELALDFLNYYLPQKLLTKLDMNTLEIEKDSFIDDQLKEYFSDLVYKANLGEKEAYLCFLMEHKSYAYSNITLQLLRYMLNIWNLKLEQQEDLPVIVPLLIYHGKKEWDIGLKLSDMITEIPVEAEEYLPDFRYIVFDLSSYKKEEIKEAALLRVFADVLSAAHQEEPKKNISDALRLLVELEKRNRVVNYFGVVIMYILQTNIVDGGLKEVKELVENVSKEKGAEVMSIAKELKKEGKKEGKKEMVKEMLEKDIEIGEVAEISGFSKEEIKELQKGMKH